MWAKAHVRAICGAGEGRKTEALQGFPGFRDSLERLGCYMLPNQARYQTSLNPDGSDSGAGALGGAGNLRGILYDSRGKCNRHFSDGMVVLRTARWFFSDGRVVFFSAGKRSLPSPSP